MVLILIFALTICSAVSATDWKVGPSGCNYTNITDAVNAASPGDTINVYDNNGSSYTYTENVFLNKANLKITSKGKVTVKAKDPDNSVFCFAGNGSSITGFTITGSTNSYGVFFGGFSYNTLRNNTIYGNWIGVRIPAENAHSTIINNTIYSNGEGIYVDDESYSLIANNTIRDNGATGTGCGINTQGSDHLTITGNNIRNNPEGIFLDGSDSATISDNILKSNTINGIYILDANNCEILRNTVNGSQTGILIETLNPAYPCMNNNIIQNTVQNNAQGIRIHGSSQNIISRNIINNNSIGIEVDDLVVKDIGVPYDGTIAKSLNNTILANNIYNNGDGIVFGSIFSTPSGNQVYCNRIANNTHWALVNYSNENVDATYNWWGSNSNPSGKIYGNPVKYSPWLILKVYVSPALAYSGGHSNITADLNHASDGSIAQNNLPDRISVLFYTNKGSIASPKTTEWGIANSVLLIPVSSFGTATVSAKIDNQTVSALVKIVDVISPKIILTYPKNYTKGYSRTAAISIKFNENIKASTYWSKIYIKNLNTGKIASISKWISGNTLNIKMSLRRYAYNWYQVYIPGSAVKDYSGNNLAARYTFKFKTGR